MFFKTKQVKKAVTAASPAGAESLLEVRQLTKSFGGVVACDGHSFSIAPGEVLGVIGPNGAGKSTLLKVIAGEQHLDVGEVLLGGQRIDGRSPAKVARHGVALAHQVPRPFSALSVRDNVRVGGLSRVGGEDSVDRILTETGLASRASEPARSLNLIDLKRLELARALSLNPRLLMLDEIAAGLIRSEIETMIELLSRLRAPDRSIVIVEHVEQVIAALATRVLVVDWGRVVAEGTPAEVADDPEVRRLYLGSGPSSPDTSAGANVGQQPVRVGAAERNEVLKLSGVSFDYGGAHALRGVDLEVRDGEVIALMGANGAGKTTVAQIIAGLRRPRQGTVAFRGEDVTDVAAHKRVGLGIGHAPEGRHVFGDLTVAENLQLGAYGERSAAMIYERLGVVEGLFPELAERPKQRAGTLSGGEQQMLAIGRALMAGPTLLVLDEVSLGLAPVVVDRLYGVLGEVNATGVALLLIEQNIHRSLAVADRAYVLDHGVVSFVGEPAELHQEDRLVEAYFGVRGADPMRPSPTVGSTGKEFLK